jgi:hypothetical protein
MTDLEKATAIFKAKYASWEQDAQRFTSGYDYERSFSLMIQEVGQEVFAGSVGEVPKDRNRKKNS